MTVPMKNRIERILLFGAYCLVLGEGWPDTVPAESVVAAPRAHAATAEAQVETVGGTVRNRQPPATVRGDTSGAYCVRPRGAIVEPITGSWKVEPCCVRGVSLEFPTFVE